MLEVREWGGPANHISEVLNLLCLMLCITMLTPPADLVCTDRTKGQSGEVISQMLCH